MIFIFLKKDSKIDFKTHIFNLYTKYIIISNYMNLNYMNLNALL